MKKLLTLAVLLLLTSFTALAQDEIQYKEYSFSEFFSMIADEEDSVFSLSNATIKVNKATDQKFIIKLGSDVGLNFVSANNDSIRVDKILKLTNIDFKVPEDQPDGEFITYGIGKAIFSKPIQCTNCINLIVAQSTFNSPVTFRFNDGIQGFDSLLAENNPPVLFLINSKFQSGVELIAFTDKKFLQLVVVDNIIYANQESNEQVTLLGTGFQDFMFANNIVEGSVDVTITTQAISSQNQGERLFNLEIRNNEFNVPRTTLGFNDQNIDFVKINDNLWPDVILASVSDLDRVNTLIDGPSLLGKLIDNETYFELFILKNYSKNLANERYSKENITLYREKLMIEDVNIYNSEVALRGLFKNYFDLRHDATSANQFYIEIKDLETRRLAYLYRQAPSFDSFFKWKINQFLKIFSAYGTEPAKAVTFSVYVILAFAFVYLFFPNHWDSHGKDRILHRYQFFLKYLNKDAGMHDVYLEGKKDELAHYDGFKNFFIENGKTVPKFFLATALPLYRWSIASTRGSSWFLEKIDIFKGKWSDLPPPQRAAKTVLLTLVFVVALTYDILIKMLNALMLSINTFTTLGFGEIPIKGLPRYLAIIQGFIGWFMLTIFSVSLISQLLN
jgi:hypothetical protein